MNIRQEARLHAAEVLDNFWNEDLYPVDPFAIAKAFDIDVYFGDLPGNVSGMLRRTGEGRVEMYIDTDDVSRRQRFTAAHELGHYVQRLKRGDLADELAFVDRRGDVASLGTDPEEMYANEFAASILMPASVVRFLKSRRLTSFEMAKFFDVSPTSMEFRLKNLGLA
jgi:hypothetical protein